MDLSNINDAFDRVMEKQKLSARTCLEAIDQVSLEMDEALSKLQLLVDPSSEHRVIFNELKTKLNEIAPLRKLEEAQKEPNMALRKFQKLLEKTFNSDISKAYGNLDPDTRMLNQIIANHLYREGLFDTGDCFLSEACEGKDEAVRASFVEMHDIREAIKSHNLDPALSWVGTNRENLIRNGSDLELKLHIMQFLEIVKHEDQREYGLKYIKEYLSPFASTHITVISRLTACLLWAGKLNNSPYSGFMSPWRWHNLAENFTRQYCNILGQSYESPLSVTIAAGIQAVPTLLKMMTVMIGRNRDWPMMEQLPVPMDLDEEFQFHSIMICPVSKEQSSDENPPMLLPCGHVLLMQSITKLSMNNSTRRFRCVYCPIEFEVGMCRRLYI